MEKESAYEFCSFKSHGLDPGLILESFHLNWTVPPSKLIILELAIATLWV